VRPVGSNQEEFVDVRIVSATHKDLPGAVAAGKFRQDLFYRINVIDIVIPPLRERTEDLPLLCETLLARIAQESDMPVPTLSTQTMEQLALNPLPGNVRELENLLHRAVALSEGDELQLDDLQGHVGDAMEPSGETGTTQQPTASPPSPGKLTPPSDLQSHLDQQEREILVQTLQETGFNRTLAAARLGLSLRQIRYRIARLKIDAPQAPDENPDA
jgi:two-component system, NtrC family, response regulator PilR